MDTRTRYGLNAVCSPLYSTLPDSSNIYAYIAFTLLVPETAKEQVNRIRKEIRSLYFMPSQYARVEWEPWRSMEMHPLPVDNFVVYYTVDDDTLIVTVIRIFYGGRNVEGIINAEKINSQKRMALLHQ